MSLTAFLLFTLPNAALAREGEEGCEEYWSDIDLPGAHYVPTVGCVVPDLSTYCDYSSGGDCISWDQVLEIYEDSPTDVKESVLLTCAEGSDYAYRWDRSSPDDPFAENYMYFDKGGFLSGYYSVAGGDPFCCEGVQTWHYYVGDPYATCIEPSDTGDTDTGDTANTPKTGPCGCATDTGAAAALLAACSLLTVRRRRQP
ncbi:hypothetical protein L6R49_24210 [Myxococcota bacterium]|nr:hypothetical protein [Myxococcota bacterium]